MPRVTQDPDFNIHEDGTSQSVPLNDGAAASPTPEANSADSSFVEDVPTRENVDAVETEEAANTFSERQGPDAAEGLDTKGLGDNTEPLTEGDESFVSQKEEEEATSSATELEEGEDDSVNDPDSRRQSSASDRRTSGRTEALIKEAARAVVALMEKKQSQSKLRPSIEEDDRDEDDSFVSRTTEGEQGVDGTDLSYLSHSEASPRQSDAYSHSEVIARHSDRHSQADKSARISEGQMAPALVDEAGGDSSSHHEAEDDVFTDPSPRSSMGSISSDPDRKQVDLDETLRQATRSPRISGISQYDKEDFVPTVRGTPRVPFRTPSDVRALQLSSPPPSVYGSPRSSKRPPFPTISRLGSPSANIQYSPKRRSTPPRFKSRKEPAPLVLLHATLLPLRWIWAGVLDAAETHQLSESVKTLRENWRQLQDVMGDTILERGILLPHPQNDYEVLEERLLEALELPLRRRARILECGHYLGPANEMAISDALESGDEDFDPESRRSSHSTCSSAEAKRSHWCATCRHEIKYDSLGPGKVFRVKVYASNGLMKGGAWEACWKEMERVDVELEPIVDSDLSDELGRLAAAQRAREEDQRMSEQQLEGHHGGHAPLEAVKVRRLSAVRMVQQQLEEHQRQQASRIMEERRQIDNGRMMEDSAADNHEDAPLDSHDDEHEHEYDNTMLVNRGTPQIVTSPPSSDMRVTSPPMDSPRVDAVRMDPSRLNSPCPESPQYGCLDTERRKRDEARLREIYGRTPPPPRTDHSPGMSSVRQPHPDSYIPPTSPPSPSAQAYERREARRRTYQNSSLPELLLEVLKVLLQDRKNLMIAVLCFLAMCLAIRGNSRREQSHNHFPAMVHHDIPTVATQEPGVGTVEQSAVSSVATSDVTVDTRANSEDVPYVHGSQGEHADAKQLDIKDPSDAAQKKTETEVETVRVFETVTETVKVTATATDVDEAPASSEADSETAERFSEQTSAAKMFEIEENAEVERLYGDVMEDNQEMARDEL